MVADIMIRHIGRGRAGQVLAALAEWTPANDPGNPLHLGDVGWFLRFEDHVVEAGLVTWSDRYGLVAVGLLDDATLRTAIAPRVRDDPAVADALLASFDEVVPPGEAWCDTVVDGALHRLLAAHGWEADEPWSLFVRRFGQAPDWPANAELVRDQTGAADRVTVQRNAFTNSTFSVERWRQMVSHPSGARCVDVLVRAEDGAAAAAATGWHAGPGRCALLEPVGTHKAYQGKGHGRTAVAAACAALAAKGASAVAVLTPDRNTPGVGLYRSAGFSLVSHPCALKRKG